MYLSKILLRNFRNLQEIFLELNPNLNILVGRNGQGKTNFLEAIFLLATASSHRTAISSELINWDKKKGLVQAMLIKREQELKLSLRLEGSRKKVEINNTPMPKVSELMGNLNVVLFSPEDLNLVKGGPAYRRNFLDLEVSQVSSYYHKLLQEYQHILKQRNNLLKDLREGKGDKGLLEIWDEKLVDLGSKIISKRLEVVEKLKILGRLAQRKITDGSENLFIDYEMSFSRQKEREDVSLIFKQELVNNRDKEIKRGYTLVGPHRDDLLLKINEMDVRKYGSQGQQRTTALALKLAELEFMKSETGEYPVLLLDDVFSELDDQRKKMLVNLIVERVQTFITTTDLNHLTWLDDASYRVLRVEDGKILEER